MNLIKSLLPVVALVCLANLGQAQTNPILTLDSYEDSVAITSAVSTSVFDAAPAGAIGDREVFLEVESNPFDREAEILLATSAGGTQFSLLESGSAVEATFRVKYDNFSKDLSSGGAANAFGIELKAADIANDWELYIDVASDSQTDTSFETFNLAQVNQFLVIPFSSFTTIDLASEDLVEIIWGIRPASLIETEAIDVIFGNVLLGTIDGEFTPVPEPSTYALLSGLVCAAFLIRRRMRRAA